LYCAPIYHSICLMEIMNSPKYHVIYIYLGHASVRSGRLLLNTETKTECYES